MPAPLEACAVGEKHRRCQIDLAEERLILKKPDKLILKAAQPPHKIGSNHDARWAGSLCRSQRKYSDHRIWRVDHGILPVPNRENFIRPVSSLMPDNDGPAHHADLWMRVQFSNLLRKLSGGPHVVRVDKRNKLTPRVPNAEIKARTQPPVIMARVFQISHFGEPRGICLRD